MTLVASVSASGSNSSSIVLPPIITLKLNGKYARLMGRFGGSQNIELSDTEDGSEYETHFKVEKLSDDTFAFKNMYNQQWLSCINRGTPEGTFDRIEAAKTEIDYACKFKVIITGDNKLCLQAYNGKFIGLSYLYGINYLLPNQSSINQYSSFEVGEPLVKKEIIHINYDLPLALKTEVTPDVVMEAKVSNPSLQTVSQTLSYEYTKSEEGTWNNSAGVEVGVATTFKAGIPFLAEGEIEVSVTGSYSHEWGGSTGIEKKITSSTQVNLNPQSEGTARVTVKKALISIPFSYIERRTYLDGTVEDREVKTGVYENVESYYVEVDVT